MTPSRDPAVQTSAHADRIRRLEQSIATGHIPSDLVPWLLEAVGGEKLKGAAALSPADRLRAALSAGVDSLVRARGVTQRELGDQRRNVQRILRGDNVTVDTIAEVAAALGCEVRIAFRRRAGDTDGATGVATTCGVESGGRTLVGNPKE